MPLPEVVIVGAARTPIGRYGGSLRNIHPAELGAVAARAAIERAGITPDAIDEVLIGHARQAGSGPNPARQVGSRAGIPDTDAGFRRAEIRWLDDCGHFPQLEHSTVVNEWLGAFVAERPAPR